MSSHAALLASIVATATPLRAVNRIRIHLHKKSSSESAQASLRQFVARRLPVLRFHNPNLAVEITRAAGNTGGGVEVTKGDAAFTLAHKQLRDDQLFATVLALDQAQGEEAELAVTGVTKGAADFPKVQAAATPAQ